MAVELTPIPLGLPRHPTEESGAPLGAPLQVVLAAEGEPWLTGGPAALRHLHPEMGEKAHCLGRFALRRRALRCVRRRTESGGWLDWEIREVGERSSLGYMSTFPCFLS